MEYSNQLSFYHGSDSWEALKRILSAVDTSLLSPDDRIDLGYIWQQIKDTEED